MANPAAPLADVAGPVEETDRIYDALLIAIRDGEVGPGQRLASERKLSTDLSAPRAAGRRAVQTLAGPGGIESGVGRAGSRVRAKAPAHVTAPSPQASPQDVLETRWAFEPGLVPLVVARATDDDFAAMARQLDRMENAASQQNSARAATISIWRSPAPRAIRCWCRFSNGSWKRVRAPVGAAWPPSTPHPPSVQHRLRAIAACSTCCASAILRQRAKRYATISR